MAAFVSYDLVNPNPQQTELSWLGEGTSDPNSVLWGTFGYASLSLGRDRYGEYVAQLLARRAVDRLVAGHKRDDESTGDSDLQIAADAAYRNLLHGLGLSRDSGSVTRLLGRKSGGEAQIRQNLELEMKDRLVQLVFSDGEFARALVGNAYLRSLNRILSSTRTEVDTAIQEAAYAHVYRWHQRFVADVLDELTVVASRNGLAVARQVIDRLRRDVSQWAHQLIRRPPPSISSPGPRASGATRQPAQRGQGQCHRTDAEHGDRATEPARCEDGGSIGGTAAGEGPRGLHALLREPAGSGPGGPGACS